MSGRERARFLPPATSLIGRERELAALDEAFARRRLVTLLGPAGVGKTRLAIEHGLSRTAELTEPEGGGVWYCDVSQATTELEVCRCVSRVVDIPLSPDRAPLEAAQRLAAAIAARGPTLLILDGFERAARSSVGVLGAWREAAPEASLLITSRTRIGLDEEAVVELGPLSLPGPGDPLGGDAVLLLVERAQAHRPDFSPAEGDQRVLAELVRRLDGLPLAIELAAARMSVLGPKQLLRRVQAGLDVLADPRQRGHGALRATLDWSWDLLEPHEKSALGQLSVFRGGFSADAAEAVLDLSESPGAPPVIDVLGSLRDQSFLHLTRTAELPDEVRFELLQIVRAYAEEKLPKADAERARERHARAFVAFGAAWARDVDREDGPEALAHLAVELENLVGVHRWALASSAPDRVDLALEAALALEPVFYMRGPTALCLTLLGEALQAAGPETPPGLVALSLKARARALRDLGRFDESDADLERALQLARGLQDRAIEGRVLAHVGAAAQARGHHEDAIAWLEKALDATREAGDQRSEGMVLAALAQSLGEVGRLDEATRAFDEAMRHHREVGNRYAAAFVSTSRAEVSRAKGHLESARLDLERGIAEYDRFGERRHEGIALTELAVILQEQGKLEEARRACDRAITCHRVFGSRLLEGQAVGQLGEVEREAGRLDASRTSYAEAAVIAREVGDIDAVARWLVSLGSAEAALGRREVGQSLIDEGEALPARTSPAHRAHVAIHRGLAALGVDRALAVTMLAESRAMEAPPGGHPAHVRLGLRLLERGLTPGSPPAAATPETARTPLWVAQSGRWFKRPDGESVNLQRRQALRLVLSRLADARQDAPGVALTPLQILEAGWPGERVRPEAGLLRVYNALSTLRRMGLRDCLLSRDDGYLIDPLVPVERVPDAP